MRQLPLGVRLADRAVFASFCAGRNTECLEHAQGLASARVGGSLWLCGPSGSGKTHLLQAICARVSEDAASTTAYLPLARLADLGPGVLEGMQSLQCLCMDDLDAVVGRREWELALFALLTELGESGGRLAVAAVSPPALLQWSVPDVGSRFTAAAIYQLRPLDEAEQLKALQLRARLRGLTLPEETVRWLQRRFPRDMRRLYELLDTLDEAAFVAQRRLTVPFIREVLRLG